MASTRTCHLLDQICPMKKTNLEGLEMNIFTTPPKISTQYIINRQSLRHYPCPETSRTLEARIGDFPSQNVAPSLPGRLYVGPPLPGGFGHSSGGPQFPNTAIVICEASCSYDGTFRSYSFISCGNLSSKARSDSLGRKCSSSIYDISRPLGFRRSYCRRCDICSGGGAHVIRCSAMLISMQQLF